MRVNGGGENGERERWGRRGKGRGRERWGRRGKGRGRKRGGGQGILTEGEGSVKLTSSLR